jgi:hypothetical protein
LPAEKSRKERRELREACLQNRFAVSAPEARKQVAHGETVSLAVKKIKLRQERQKPDVKTFLSPHPGLGRFAIGNPRFHRGLLSVAAPQLQLDLEDTP